MLVIAQTAISPALQVPRAAGGKQHCRGLRVCQTGGRTRFRSPHGIVQARTVAQECSVCTIPPRRDEWLSKWPNNTQMAHVWFLRAGVIGCGPVQGRAQPCRGRGDPSSHAIPPGASGARTANISLCPAHRPEFPGDRFPPRFRPSPSTTSRRPAPSTAASSASQRGAAPRRARAGAAHLPQPRCALTAAFHRSLEQRTCWRSTLLTTARISPAPPKQRLSTALG